MTDRFSYGLDVDNYCLKCATYKICEHHKAWRTYERAQSRLNRAAVAWVNAFLSGWSSEIERRETKLVSAVRAFQRASKR